MLSGDQNKPNPNSALGDSAVPETPTTGGTTENNLPSGFGPGTMGRTLLDNLITRTSTMAMPGELHPQAGTHPASMSTGSSFAIGAGLTSTASTGGTTKKTWKPPFGVRSSKEGPRTSRAGQPTTTEVVADGRPEGAMNTGGVASAQKGSVYL